MAVAEVPLKVSIDAALKERFNELLERKRITAKDGIQGMVRWVLEQDTLLQSIVLGQIEEKDTDAVLSLVVQRRQDPRKFDGLVTESLGAFARSGQKKADSRPR